VSDIKFSRVWAMPNSNTFEVPPIADFVKRYLRESKVSIDPFARNNGWATYTNDLNPNTSAQYHMEAGDFLNYLATLGVEADLFVLDPPYSARQLKECYDDIGRKMLTTDAMTGAIRKNWRNAALKVLTKDAVALNFGWSTVGFGKKNGFEIEEIMLVCHGSDHCDTICAAERRITRQDSMFDSG